MSATNLMETIKRRFGILAGAAIGLLLGILILYACDNEKVSSGTKDCVTKPECSDYDDLAQGDCDDAYVVFRWPKGCVSDSESNTNCNSDTALCWYAVNCEWNPVSEKCSRTIRDGDITEANFGTRYYQIDCPENSSSSW